MSQLTHDELRKMAYMVAASADAEIRMSREGIHPSNWADVDYLYEIDNEAGDLHHWMEQGLPITLEDAAWIVNTYRQ